MIEVRSRNERKRAINIHRNAADASATLLPLLNVQTGAVIPSFPTGTTLVNELTGAAATRILRALKVEVIGCRRDAGVVSVRE